MMKDEYEIIKKLVETDFKDIKWYIELVKVYAKHFHPFYKFLEPNTKNYEIFKLELHQIEEEYPRDGWSIDLCGTIDGVVHKDVKWRALRISSVWVNNPPHPRVVGISPIFQIPVYIFENIIIKGKDFSLQIMYPAYSDHVFLTVPSERLIITIKEFKDFDTEGEMYKIYDLWIETK